MKKIENNFTSLAENKQNNSSNFDKENKSHNSGSKNSINFLNSMKLKNQKINNENNSNIKTISFENNISKNISYNSNNIDGKLNSLIFPANRSIKADPLPNLNKFPDEFKNSGRINRISNLLGRIFNKKLNQIQNHKILQNISCHYTNTTHNLTNDYENNLSIYNINSNNSKIYDSLSPNIRKRAEIEKINLDDIPNKRSKRQKSEKSNNYISNYDNLKNKYYNKFFNENEILNRTSPQVITCKKASSDNIDTKKNNYEKKNNLYFNNDLSFVSVMNFNLIPEKKIISENSFNNTNHIINCIDEFIQSDKNKVNDITINSPSSILSNKNNKNFFREDLQISTFNNYINQKKIQQEEIIDNNNIDLFNLNNSENEIYTNQIYHNINLSIFSNNKNNINLNQEKNECCTIINRNISLLDNISANNQSNLINNMNNISEIEIQEIQNLTDKKNKKSEEIFIQNNTNNNISFKSSETNKINISTCSKNKIIDEEILLTNNNNNHEIINTFRCFNNSLDNNNNGINHITDNKNEKNETIKIKNENEEEEENAPNNFSLEKSTNLNLIDNNFNTSKISNGNNSFYIKTEDKSINSQKKKEIPAENIIFPSTFRNNNSYKDALNKEKDLNPKNFSKNTNSYKNLPVNTLENINFFNSPIISYENNFINFSNNNILIQENKEENGDVSEELADNSENNLTYSDNDNRFNQLNKSLNVISEEESNDLETLQNNSQDLLKKSGIKNQDLKIANIENIENEILKNNDFKDLIESENKEKEIINNSNYNNLVHSPNLNFTNNSSLNINKKNEDEFLFFNNNVEISNIFSNSTNYKFTEDEIYTENKSEKIKENNNLLLSSQILNNKIKNNNQEKSENIIISPKNYILSNLEEKEKINIINIENIINKPVKILESNIPVLDIKRSVDFVNINIDNKPEEKKSIKITAVVRSRSKEKRNNSIEIKINKIENKKEQFSNQNKLANKIIDSPNIKLVKKEFLEDYQKENLKLSNNFEKEIKKPEISVQKKDTKIISFANPQNFKNEPNILFENLELEKFIKNLILSNIVEKIFLKNEENKTSTKIPEKNKDIKNKKLSVSFESDLNSSLKTIGKQDNQDTIDIEASLINQIFQAEKKKITISQTEKKNYSKKSEFSLVNQVNFIITNNLPENNVYSEDEENPKNNQENFYNNSNLNSISIIEAYSNVDNTGKYSNNNSENEENKQFCSIDNTDSMFVIEKQVYLQLNSVGCRKNKNHKNFIMQKNYENEKSYLENITENIDLENMSSISKSRISNRINYGDESQNISSKRDSNMNNVYSKKKDILMKKKILENDLVNNNKNEKNNLNNSEKNISKEIVNQKDYSMDLVYDKNTKFIISENIENNLDKENKFDSKIISLNNSPIELSGSSNSIKSKERLKSLSSRLEKLKIAKSELIEKNKKILEEKNIKIKIIDNLEKLSPEKPSKLEDNSENSEKQNDFDQNLNFNLFEKNKPLANENKSPIYNNLNSENLKNNPSSDLIKIVDNETITKNILATPQQKENEINIQPKNNSFGDRHYLNKNTENLSMTPTKNESNSIRSPNTENKSYFNSSNKKKSILSTDIKQNPYKKNDFPENDKNYFIKKNKTSNNFYHNKPEKNNITNKKILNNNLDMNKINSNTVNNFYPHSAINNFNDSCYDTKPQNFSDKLNYTYSITSDDKEINQYSNYIYNTEDSKSFSPSQNKTLTKFPTSEKKQILILNNLKNQKKDQPKSTNTGNNRNSSARKLVNLKNPNSSLSNNPSAGNSNIFNNDKSLRNFKSNPTFAVNKITNIIKKIKNRPVDETNNTISNMNNTMNNFNVPSFNQTNNNKKIYSSTNPGLNHTISGNNYEGNKNLNKNSRSKIKNNFDISKKNNFLINNMETNPNTNQVYLNTERNNPSKKINLKNNPITLNKNNSSNINIEEDIFITETNDLEIDLISEDGDNFSSSNQSENLTKNEEKNKNDSNIKQDKDSTRNNTMNLIKIPKISKTKKNEKIKINNPNIKYNNNNLLNSLEFDKNRIKENNSLSNLSDQKYWTNIKVKKEKNEVKVNYMITPKYTQGNQVVNLTNAEKGRINTSKEKIIFNKPDDSSFSKNVNKNLNEILNNLGQNQNEMNNIFNENKPIIKKNNTKNNYHNSNPVEIKSKQKINYVHSYNPSVKLDKYIENLKIALDNYIKASRGDKDLLKDIIRDNLSNIKKENELQKSLIFVDDLNNFKKENNNIYENKPNSKSVSSLKQFSEKNNENKISIDKDKYETLDENEFNKLSDDPEEIKNFIISQLENFKLGLVKERLDKYFEKIRDSSSSPNSDLCSSPMRHLLDTDEENRDKQSEYEPIELDRSQMTQFSLNGSLRKSVSNVSSYYQDFSNNPNNKESSNSLRGRLGSLNEIFYNNKNPSSFVLEQGGKDPKSKERCEELQEISENSQEIYDLASSRDNYVTNIKTEKNIDVKYDTYDSLFNSMPTKENYNFYFEDYNNKNNSNNSLEIDNENNKKLNTVDILTKEFMKRKMLPKDPSMKDNKIMNLKKILLLQQKNNY